MNPKTGSNTPVYVCGARAPAKIPSQLSKTCGLTPALNDRVGGIYTTLRVTRE